MDLETSVVELANEIAKNVVRVRADAYKDLNTEALTQKLVQEYYKSYARAIREIHQLKSNKDLQQENNGKILS